MKNAFVVSYGNYALTPEDHKKREILETGMQLWPYATARGIGREIDNSHSAILFHFGNSDLLQLDVARYAVATGNAKVIVQLLASGHVATKDMKPADKKNIWMGWSSVV